MWYRYHFQQVNCGGLSRDVFKSRLDEYLKKTPYYQTMGYQKNLTVMFELFRPNVVQAIRNAECAYEGRNASVPYSQRNPVTAVYLLIADLMRYLLKGG